MQIDRSRMQRVRRARLLRRAEEAPRVLLDDRYNLAGCADIYLRSRRAASAPIPFVRAPLEHSGFVQPHNGSRISGTENLCIGVGKWQLERCAAEMRISDVGIGGIDHCGFVGLTEDLFRVGNDVL